MSDAHKFAARSWRGLSKISRQFFGDRRFAAIVSGRTQALVIYDTLTVMAFLDISPESPGHALVIPKRRVASMLQVDERTLCDIYEAARLIAKAQAAVLGAEGVFLRQANGPAAGQSVLHMHLHVIPCWQASARRPNDEPAAIAAALRSSLRASFSTMPNETLP